VNSCSVSVLLAVYNDAKRLRRSVSSIQQQTFQDWELLIANDGSTDDTLRVAHSLAREDPRIRVCDLPHRGAAQARNSAAAIARGAWLLIQDCDDYSAPERIETLLRVADEHPSAGVIASYATRVSSAGQALGLLQMGPTSLEEFKKARTDRPFYVINGTAMMRRDLFLKVGGYPVDYRVGEDLALFNLRMASQCDVLVLPEPLVFVEMHQGSLSRKYANEIVESDDIVQFNLARIRRGESVLSYGESLEQLNKLSQIHTMARKRRQLRHAWFSRGIALASSYSPSGLGWLFLALTIAPLWTAQRLAPRILSVMRQ